MSDVAAGGPTSPARSLSASGREAMLLSCQLLHRVRRADDRAGVWEAADLQWWWRRPRVTDDLPQAFLTDDDGPVATARLTDWTDSWGLDVLRAPGAPVGWGEVAGPALAAARSAGAPAVESLVRVDDDEARDWLTTQRFVAGARSWSGWLAPADRPTVPALPDGYALVDRSGRSEGEHPMATRSGPEVEQRLQECPLYDPTLDLAVVAPDGAVAAYAMFWNDPATGIGLVEPVRVEDAHSGQGLGYAMVAEGLDRMARAGAALLKIGWETPRAGELYSRLGFSEPVGFIAYRWEA